MDSTSISQQFYTRFYYWLLREIHDEVRHGFPLLRKVKCFSALESIEVMKQLNQVNKLLLATTIIRKVYQEGHRSVLEIINEPWNENDEAIWKKYQASLRKISRYKLLKEFSSLESQFPINLRLLKQAIMQKLNSIENFTFNDEGYKIISKFEVNYWKIEAIIELHEPPTTVLKYYYNIQGVNSWNLTEHKIYLFEYLGIYNPWDLFTMQNLSETVDVISTLCQKFAQALSQILKDIPQPKLSDQETKIYKLRELSESFNKRFFKQRYYWSLNDAIREVNESFPFIKRINNRWAVDALCVMKNLEKSEQLKVAKALVKYAHWNYLTDDEILTDDEMNILINSKVSEQIVNSDTIILNSNVQPLTITKKELRNWIKRKLKPIIGPVIQSDNEGWDHQIKFDNWQIKTYIELDGYALSYWHHISDAETGIFTIGRAHILGWLGIGESYWNIFSDTDALEAIETLFSVCKHFIEALPIILDGLDPNEAVKYIKNP